MFVELNGTASQQVNTARLIDVQLDLLIDNLSMSEHKGRNFYNEPVYERVCSSSYSVKL